MVTVNTKFNVNDQFFRNMYTKIKTLITLLNIYKKLKKKTVIVMNLLFSLERARHLLPVSSLL